MDLIINYGNKCPGCAAMCMEDGLKLAVPISLALCAHLHHGRQPSTTHQPPTTTLTHLTVQWGFAAGDLVYGLCCPLPVKLQTPHRTQTLPYHHRPSPAGPLLHVRLKDEGSRRSCSTRDATQQAGASTGLGRCWCLRCNTLLALPLRIHQARLRLRKKPTDQLGGPVAIQFLHLSLKCCCHDSCWYRAGLRTAGVAGCGHWHQQFQLHWSTGG